MMWMFLWRYVIVPLLVAILTWSASQRRHAAEREEGERAARALVETIRELRQRLWRYEDERRPFRPRPHPAPDAGRLPPEAIGERPELELREEI